MAVLELDAAYELHVFRDPHGGDGVEARHHRSVALVAGMVRPSEPRHLDLLPLVADGGGDEKLARRFVALGKADDYGFVLVVAHELHDFITEVSRRDLFRPCRERGGKHQDRHDLSYDSHLERKLVSGGKVNRYGPYACNGGISESVYILSHGYVDAL